MKNLFIAMLLLVTVSFASQNQQEFKQIGPREAGKIAFINEVNQTVAETGMSVDQAKEICWREFQVGSGEHYQDIIEWSWQWKSWYGYSTLFCVGVGIGYACM